MLRFYAVIVDILSMNDSTEGTVRAWSLKNVNSYPKFTFLQSIIFSLN